ncbi:hypothetical protein [Myxococcus phage Mx1]|nr:hypothetical protein [Myxococcus phage Mx1]
MKPEIGTRVKYLGDIANQPFTGTVVNTWEDRWGEYMDVQPDTADGETAPVKKGVPCHAFPETGAGKRWVLAVDGERVEAYPDFDPDMTNCD